MPIIHTGVPKYKPRKKSAKMREQEALTKKIAAERKAFLNTKREEYVPPKTYVRETPYIPSLNSGHHSCAKKEQHMYTGTLIIGIATMHKSNAVPIFSQEDAKEVSRMRRG